MTDLTEIGRMSMRDYRIRCKAAALEQLDRERDIHLQAWKNQAAKATKKVGKGKLQSVYPNFEAFFNFKKHEDEILERVYKPSKLAQRMMDWEAKNNE